MTSASIAVPDRMSRNLSGIWRFCRSQPLGAAGLVVIVAMLFAGTFAEWVTPYDPLDVDYAAMLTAPSAAHWLGTDDFGRDILSRVIYGSRTALTIGR